jgi:ABC-type antimicrobial peptide transport system permease subunit
VANQTGWLPWTTEELKANSDKQAAAIERISTAMLLATLLIAGFGLAISIAAGLLERKRPFALLRLAGTSAAQLRRVLITETAAPLLTATVASATVASAGIGFAVAGDMIHAAHLSWHPPAASYWALLATGTAAALAIALLTTIPLLGKLTAPDAARFE